MIGQSMQDRWRYRDYRRRLDARKVLEHYGAQNCTEQISPDGTTEIIHSCLIDRVEPHHANGDQNPSASCNIEKKLYVCYSYWGGDLFHLIAKMERKEAMEDISSVVAAFLSGATSDKEDFLAEVTKLFSGETDQHVELPTYSPRVLDPWLVNNPYWETRGVTIEAVKKMSLGYDDREKRVVFPVFYEDQLVGWQKRMTPDTSPQWPKYRNSLGFPKAETLYNWDMAKMYNNVVVVESPMSVARAVSLAFPAVVATFGAKVTAHQIDLLKRRGFDHIYIWFDADTAGQKGERKLVESLYMHTHVHVVTPEEKKDMGDCASDSELVMKLMAASPAALKLDEYSRRNGG